MKKENITIHDIARLLEVSPSTVSRALNDNPRISVETRNTIKTLAEEQGYQPNNIATSLRKGKSKTIGMIIPRINRFFFSNIIGGMEEMLTEAGYNLMICQTLERYAKELKSLKTLLNLRVDAIFISLSTGTKNTEHINELINKGVNIYMFDRVDENLEVNSVQINDYKGAYNTVNHLINQGYRKIVHFSGPEYLNVYANRKRGYREALETHGIPYSEKYVFHDTITREKGAEVFHYLFEEGMHPDAIFSASDFSALGALLAARDHRMIIPDDIGIAGFSNEPFTEFIQPGMTTTDQNADKMGKVIAGLFLQNNKNNKNNNSKTITKEMIDPRLIIRGSSMKINV